MTDLATTYLGLNLKNPLVASASPLSKNIENAKFHGLHINKAHTEICKPERQTQD